MQFVCIFFTLLNEYFVYTAYFKSADNIKSWGYRVAAFLFCFAFLTL